MNVFELTRALVDIESISDNEGAVGAFLQNYLAKIAERTGGRVERMDVEPGRFNVLASWGTPLVTLSTHMDTVPPFIPSRDDGEFIWGRGACDAKGIIASMTGAAEKLLAEGVSNFGLLFVVGEERNSAGAAVAARTPRGSRYLVNGEPTESKLALASKGTLRYELIARGKMAHSAYPELGESAIEKLLDALEAIRRVPLPTDPLMGRSTMNIGTIAGGRAPNVIADAAKAEILVRLVGDAAPVREAFARAVGAKAELNEVLCIGPIHFQTVDSLPTTVVSFTTDVPVFGKTWGEPLLLGPGSILVAHTENERIARKELSGAVEMYAEVVRRLQS
ncbi:MAG TPA: M20/M25/M40 family metallo-hydrolase [Candidatus Baltobacteraceae bacterium]|nr:M20/M25/M40 family metallo-hydrolase [Candidatus Baltobacteraceae bacterium]